MPAGPDRRCGAREAAKPWGKGWWVCKKMVGTSGTHKGRHSFEEQPGHGGFASKLVKP